MNEKELLSVLKKIRHELNNPLNREAALARQKDFKYDDFKTTINDYIENIHLIKHADDPLEESIIKYCQELSKYLVDGSVGVYIHKFLSAAIYLQDHNPTNFPEYYIGKPETSEVDNSDSKFGHMPEARITQLENERLKTAGKIQDLEEKLNSYKEHFNDLDTLHKQTKNVHSEYINAKEAVLKDIKLQKSYMFWKSQGTSYGKKYWGYLLASIILSALLLFSVFDFLKNNPLVINGTSIYNQKNNIQKDINSSINLKSIENNNSIQLWEYGFLILLTSMVIWLIKIMMKITLSNYHLSIDAKERVIMIRTYLALIKEGKGFEIEDKKVILDNIFRPTNFGIIKDETSLTIADVIGALKK